MVDDHVHDENDDHESNQDDGDIRGGVRNHHDENDDHHKSMAIDFQDCCNSICRIYCTYVPNDANRPTAYLNAILKVLRWPLWLPKNLLSWRSTHD